MRQLLMWLVTFWAKQLLMAVVNFMADPTFSELSATTRTNLRDGVVYNWFFVDTAFQDHIRREGANDPFEGGTMMQETFQYQGPDGGGVAPGATVTVTKKQLLAGLGFQPKAYVSYMAVDDFETANGENPGVLNAGPEQAVDIYLAYMESLTEQLNTYMEMDVYRHGQANSANVTDNRILLINGMSEAFNNGIDPSWDGNIFLNYGSQVRNGAIANTMNSIPQWAGNPDGSTGQISYEFLIQSYSKAIKRPTFSVTSQLGYTYIAALFQAQQRFDVLGVRKDGIKWAGIQFEDAIIYQDWLVPSAVDPAYLPTNLVGGAGNTNLTATIAIGASPSAASGLPASTTVTVGETLWWLNGGDFRWRPTTNKAWFFGIRQAPFPDNVSVDAIFMRLACNLYNTAPRNSIQCYGFGS